LFAKKLSAPLGLRTASYNPPADRRGRSAPTEKIEPWRRRVAEKRGRPYAKADVWIQGEVHDPLACFMGGVSGNAGLFATIGDVACFLRLMVNEGEFKGKRMIRKDTIRTWTKRAGPTSTRALGWDTKSEEGSSAGTQFSMSSYGHTGFTGTGIWIDPERGIFGALLSNRVHPTAENEKIKEFRPRFYDETARILGAQR
jgi:CubicO group peptidase (beta-lactamase class C family)